jgi:alpha-glucosidase
MGDVMPVALPGFQSSRLEQGVVALEALDVFCARV